MACYDLPYSLITDTELKTLLNNNQFVATLPYLDLSEYFSNLEDPSLNSLPTPAHTNHNIACSYSSPEDIKDWPLPPNAFSILNINARSLSANLTKIKLLLLNFPAKPDVLAISETWLLPNNSLKLFHLDGYNLISFPRTNKKKRGGGIALYINNLYNFNTCSKTSQALANHCEFTAIELQIRFQHTITILNIYRPPDLDSSLFIESLSEFVDCLKANKNTFL